MNYLTFRDAKRQEITYSLIITSVNANMFYLFPQAL